MKRKNMKRGAALFLSAAVIFSGGWGTIPQYVHAEELVSEQDMKEETGQPETDAETTTDITETEPVTNLPGETLQQAGEEEMKPKEEQTEPVQEESAADGDQEQKKAAAANAETLAEGDVPLDEEHFPDEVFRNLVAEQLDANDNNVIETDEQADAAIIVSGEITTLDGIGYLSGLFGLGFQNCVVGEADVRECKNLKAIQFIENVSIGTLDASGIEGLQVVTTKAQDIEEMEELTGGVSVGTICFDDCVGLKTISLYGYMFEKISLAGATGLESMFLVGDGNTESLDFTGFNELKSLVLSGKDAFGFEGELNVKELILDDVPALTELGVACRGMEELDVSRAENLQMLGVGAMSADMLGYDAPETAYPLQKLVLGEHMDLEALICKYTKVKELDLSGCPNITSLNIDNNKELSEISGEVPVIREIVCSNTNLEELNLNNSPRLRFLICSDTKLQNLDVSKNQELVVLDCSNTGIKNLDVSKATGLTLLSITDTEITGLTFASNLSPGASYDYLYGIPDGSVVVWASGTEVSAFNGEDWNDATLYFTDYAEVGPKDMISINLSEEQEEALRNSLTTEYSSTIAMTAEDGTVSMKEYYPLFDTDRVVSINGASIDDNGVVSDFVAGQPVTYTYRYGADGELMTVTLNISVPNSWEQELSIDDITYGGTPSPSAVPLYGKDAVKYVYSTQKDGNYTENVPVTAGTYWVKAVAPAGEGYAELTSDPVSFEIQKAVPKFEVPSGLTAKEGQTLKDVKLPAGFTWADESQSVGKAGTHTFKAVYTPEDTVNYEIVEGIEIKVQVSADAVSGGSGSTGGKDNTADNGKNSTPSTGVSEYPWLWLGMLVLSGGTLGLTAWKKRRQL